MISNQKTTQILFLVRDKPDICQQDHFQDIEQLSCSWDQEY